MPWAGLPLPLGRPDPQPAPKSHLDLVLRLI
jgi:hypothetical protein